MVTMPSITLRAVLRLLLRVLLSLLAALSLYCCGAHEDVVKRIVYPDETSDGPPFLEPAKDWYRVLYYPYVEEIIVPEAIYENEAFKARIRVSAEYRERVLRGYAYMRKHPDNGDGSLMWDEFSVDPMPESSYDGYILLSTFVDGAYLTGVGSLVDHFTYDFPSGLPAGKYLIKTGTVRERRAGGAGIIFGEDIRTVGGDPIMFQVGTKMLELDLVVLPAGSAGGQ